MNYQKGYVTIFTGLTKLSELLSTLEEGEIVNVINCIKLLQEKAEEACIDEE